MAPLSRWLAPVRRIASAFFQQDVSLKRRDDGQLHVVLGARGAPAKAVKVKRAEADRRRKHAETMLVRTELAALLNELPETRATMKHLVFVEQAMARKGLKVLHKVPLDALRRAHEQLENLVVNWSAPGLANLRSKMAVAIIDREHMDPNAEADAYRTAALLEHDVDDGDDTLPTLPVDDAAPPDDESALAAAYAALGDLAPKGRGSLDTPDAPLVVELHGELGSSSARALRTMPAPLDDKPDEISIRVLQP